MVWESKKSHLFSREDISGEQMIFCIEHFVKNEFSNHKGCNGKHLRSVLVQRYVTFECRLLLALRKYRDCGCSLRQSFVVENWLTVAYFCLIIISAGIFFIVGIVIVRTAVGTAVLFIGRI